MQVVFHGLLAREFQSKFKVEVDSVYEAVRAVEANTGRFYKFLADKKNEHLFFQIYIEKDPIVSIGELDLKIKNKNKIHFVPVIRGNLSNEDMMLYGGLGMGLGWGLGMLGDWIGGFWGNVLSWVGDMVFEIGASLLLQGAINSLMPDVEDPPTIEDEAAVMKSSQSFTFQQPVNNIQQGAAVPVGYGRLRVGSNVISSHLLNSRIAAFNDISDSIVDENGNTVGAITVDQYRS